MKKKLQHGTQAATLQWTAASSPFSQSLLMSRGCDKLPYQEVLGFSNRKEVLSTEQSFKRGMGGSWPCRVVHSCTCSSSDSAVCQVWELAVEGVLAVLQAVHHVGRVLWCWGHRTVDSVLCLCPMHHDIVPRWSYNHHTITINILIFCQAVDELLVACLI